MLIDGRPTPITKIFKLDHSLWKFAGGSGNLECILDALKWLQDGDDRPYPSFDDDNFNMILISYDNRSFWMGKRGIPVEIRASRDAIGSGAAYALGAMAMGATAEQAVKIAAEHDVQTGSEVDVL